MPVKGENLVEEKIVRGIMSLYILREISLSPCHGYDLQQRIEKKTGIEMPPGTVYVLLKTLRDRNFLSVERENNERGQEILIYSITESGIEFLRDHYKALKIARSMIDDLLMVMEKLQ
ncbi:MAG: PadR family transcriptional regulator [Candidatus Thermoplasmatota archaeon]|jgi:DNA-binding PadR family transcriptional regulator|nr:PadR family transcriptional regulator [Candidatus Thermoplasmatota archaeon]MCL5790589.1 PadR family transcriptional regulator [Candidatus Thermoplasmatota archaeon]